MKRQNQFVLNRLKKGKELRKADDIREVKQNIHLVKSPAAKSGIRLEEKLVEIVEEHEDMEAEEEVYDI